MAKTSYLRFNPDTREIEIEGSEEFVKTYFDKLQQMLPKLSGEVKKARLKTKAKAEIPAPRKAIKVASKKAAASKSQEVSLIDKVVGLIQESAEGITTAELKDKTGLTETQIWGITSRATKLGKIKKTKRGVYLPG
jgi:hypothetical protein